MKKIHLTFDYELFFGPKCGTPENCLLKPTSDLLDYFKEHNISATFFVDVLYLIQLSKSTIHAHTEKLIKQQLIEILKTGSRIELHIHPHWIDAQYINDNWVFKSYDNFRLQSFDSNHIDSLICECISVLEGIACEVIPNYKVTTFRAGGFCIQPFETLKHSFLKYRIYFDSSVAPEFVGKSFTHQFNFSNAPKISAYKFNNDPLVPESDGVFTEIPITTYKKSFFSKIILKFQKLIKKSQFKQYGDGHGIFFPIPLKDKIFPSYKLLTLDGEILPYEIEQIINQTSNDSVLFISHPKSLSKISFLALDTLISRKFEFISLYYFINKSDVLK